MHRSIEVLGIPQQKVNQFYAKNIYTLGGLATFKPRRYLDYRTTKKVKDVTDKEDCIMFLKVMSKSLRDNNVFLNCIDRNGDKIYLAMFHRAFAYKAIREGECYFFTGKIGINPPFINMTVSMFSQEKDKLKRIYPVYPKISKMSDDYLISTIQSAIELISSNEFLDKELLDKYQLMDNKKSLRVLHGPTSFEELEEAKRRIMFNDLFIANLKIQKENHKEYHDLEIKNFELSKKIMEALPFDLTEGQSNALRGMTKNLMKGEVLKALVQGDVGCGKTILALLILSVIIDNDAQGALMAPTTVLAKQHYADAVKYFEPLGIKVGLLTGETKAREKKKILKELKDGDIRLLIGTHSLISNGVEFQKLRMAVIDEEHRFGVEQREALKEKGEHVSLISVSATPIPRSLAFTMYGDTVEIYVVKGLPKGRQPITTTLTSDISEGYSKIIEEVRKGRQGYVVCPLIEDSDSDRLTDVLSVESTEKALKEYLKVKGAEDIKVGVINGNMTQETIVEEIGKFANKEYDVIISTTIIEVGVNVPNSTMILIQNAERFGLAQLHQLRGRVGRGSFKSYCMLQTNKKNEDTLKKLNVIVDSQDGFVISEEDLLLRGTGNLIGLEQSGSNKLFEYMIRNKELNEQIIEDVRKILESPTKRFRYKRLLERDDLITERTESKKSLKNIE